MKEKLMQGYSKYLEQEASFKTNYVSQNNTSEAMSSLLNYPETSYTDWLEIEKVRLRDKQVEGYASLRNGTIHLMVTTIITIILTIVISSFNLEISLFFVMVPALLVYLIAIFNIIKGFHHIYVYQNS